MKSYDQSPEAGCRTGMIFAVMTSAMLLSAVAQAELDVQLLVSSTGTVAPASLVATASISGDDPVIEYDWQGLGDWPPCTGPRCEIEMPLAACRRVSVQVTGLSGAISSADTQLCISDGNGAPPQARLQLQALSTGLRVRPTGVPRDAPIVASYFYVDAEQVDEAAADLNGDSGCHAVDFIVVDAEGRTGQDRRTLCLSMTGPQISLGAQPLELTNSSTQSLCTALDHPLGLDVGVVASDFVSTDGCADPDLTPSVLRRVVLTAEDSAGVRAHASLMLVRVPDQGPPTLAWLSRPNELSFDQVDGLDIVGGQSPFVVEAEVYSESGATQLVVGVTPQAERQVKLRIPPAPLIAAGYRIRATVTDARGVGTTLDMPVTREQIGLDAGVGRDGSLPAAVQSDSAACTSLGGEGAAPLLLPLLLAAFRRRRRL